MTVPWVDPVGGTVETLLVNEVVTYVVVVVYPGSTDSYTVPLCEPDGGIVLYAVVVAWEPVP